MRIIFFTAMCLLGFANFSLSAIAAPQVLLLVATGDDVKLVCEGSECAADVSSLCLQPERGAPEWGTRYALMEDPKDGLRIESALSLIAHTVEGRPVSLPVTGNLRITAERGQSAVKLSVQQSVLNSLGLADPTVRLTRSIALAPETPIGEPMQAESDLARAGGPLRRIAERVVTSRDEQLIAARIVRDAINALPRDRRASMAEFTSAWQKASAVRRTGDRARISIKAHRLAGEARKNCLHAGSGAPAFDDYRTCLGVMHDQIMERIGDAYWDALNIGS